MYIFEWLKEKNEGENKGNILAPYMKPQEAVNFLCKYLLGEDWYDASGATHPEQVNTTIVFEILDKYSNRFKKELKSMRRANSKKERMCKKARNSKMCLNNCDNCPWKV